MPRSGAEIFLDGFSHTWNSDLPMAFQLYEPISHLTILKAKFSFCFSKLKEFWLIHIWARFLSQLALYVVLASKMRFRYHSLSIYDTYGGQLWIQAIDSGIWILRNLSFLGFYQTNVEIGHYPNFSCERGRKCLKYVTTFLLTMKIFIGYQQMIFEYKTLWNEVICPHDINYFLKFCCISCRLHFCFN